MVSLIMLNQYTNIYHCWWFSSTGCDSIVTLDLTINNFVTGTDVQTACNSLILGLMVSLIMHQPIHQHLLMQLPVLTHKLRAILLYGLMALLIIQVPIYQHLLFQLGQQMVATQ
jgi:hypothetical protein